MTDRDEMLFKATYEIAKEMVTEWDLEPQEIVLLADRLPAYCKGIREALDEDAWQRQQEDLAASGGPDDSSYRRSMIDAGRGHLIR